MLLVPIQGVESIAIGVYIAAGSREEEWRTNGAAHFLEHMVFKGTKKFPTRKDTSILETHGAIQNGYTYSEATAYWAKLPADHWKLGLEVQKELALNPLIRARELQKERGVILEEIHRRDDVPEDKIWEVFYHMRYPNQSLGWSTLGRPEVIQNIRQEDFVRFHETNYVATNLLVVAAGKIQDKKALIGQIQDWFGKLPKKKAGKREMPKEVKGPNVSLVTKEDANQAHFVLGVGTFTLHDERQFELAVLNRILGYGLSGRLFLSLREKRGLAYAVYSDFELESDHGYWAAYAGVKTANIKEAIKVILEELEKLATKKVSIKELDAAKEKVRGPLIFAMEDPYRQMEFYAKQALWRPNKILTPNKVIEKVMAVTREDIQSLAHAIFQKEKLHLAIIGPYKDGAKWNKLLS